MVVIEEHESHRKEINTQEAVAGEGHDETKAYLLTEEDPVTSSAEADRGAVTGHGLTEMQDVTQRATKVVGLEIGYPQLRRPGQEEEEATEVSPKETPFSGVQIIKSPIVLESFHFPQTRRISLLKQ